MVLTAADLDIPMASKDMNSKVVRAHTAIIITTITDINNSRPHTPAGSLTLPETSSLSEAPRPQ